MVGTDLPVGILITVVVGILVAAWLFRVGTRARPVFECILCGRKQPGLAAREWRYCPYCGHPRPPPQRIPGIQL